VDEVQYVEFESEGGLGGTYTITVTAQVKGRTLSHTSAPISMSASEAEIASTLDGLNNTQGVEVMSVECDDENCRYTVTFLNMDANVPTITIDDSLVTGNSMIHRVTTVTHGRQASHIIDSPFTMFTSPDVTNAAYTTAYGQGLVYGVTGVTSKFTIQSKDAWGNNKLDSQERDIYKIVAFIADRDFDDDFIAVDGSVSYSGNKDFGGTYDVEFTPVISGEYTISVMLGEVLEVQNISTGWTSLADRSGYFTLSYGVCTDINPCPVTKRLAWDATGEDVEQALEELAGVGDVSVTFSQTTDLMNSAWLVTFNAACDMNTIFVHEGNVPIQIDVIEEGECSVIKAAEEDSIMTYPFVNMALVREEQQLVVDATSCGGGVSCTFAMSFRGHVTDALAWDATTDEVQSALEALTTVGSVVVTKNENALVSTFEVVFHPDAGSTLSHIQNIGDLPNIVMTSDSILDSELITTQLVAGSGPFTAHVEAITVDAASCTVVDEKTTAGRNGLSTGIYLDTTSFVIEARDQFDNRVHYGPKEEVQIIETFAGANLTGSFSVTFGGHTVDVSARIGIAGLEAALETLPSLGSVDVSTNSVKDDSGLTAHAIEGSPLLHFSVDPSSVFGEGDWIRLFDNNTGPVYTVVYVDTTENTVTLSSPYSLDTNTAVSVYTHPRSGYQYIVTFESNLGDLPALEVDGTLLFDVLNMNASVTVTSCDLLTYQVVRTSAASAIGGTFYLSMNGDRTQDLQNDVNATVMKEALEKFEGIYNVDITRSGPWANGGYDWTVIFKAYDTYPTMMYAEGLLLEGIDAAVTIENKHCPSTSISGTNVVSVGGNVGEVFMASLSGQADNRATVQYLDDGIYEVTYMTPRLGAYNLTIAKTIGNGLNGSYFNNRWMYGDPIMTRLDSVLDFMWSEDDTITETGKDYISVRWTGYILPSFNEEYDMMVTVNDGVRLWINDVLLIDEYDNDLGESDQTSMFSAPVTLVAGQLASIKIEYRENTGVAAFTLAWSSTSQPYEVIPTSRMFPAVQEVVGSPYQVRPTGRKPTVVQDVSLKIESWDNIAVTFFEPADDGGSPIVDYVVEWYSADLEYGPFEVQTIQMSADVTGGTFQLTSPGGVRYPYDVLFDATPDVVEEILERMPDVGDVDVHYFKNDTSHSWKVTFLTNLGNIGDLGFDDANLITTVGGDKMQICTSNSTATVGSTLACQLGDSQDGGATLVDGGVSGAPYDEVDMEIGSRGYYTYTCKGVKQDSAITDGYYVRVSAVNLEGWVSVPSLVQQLKPMEVPDAPAFAEVLRAAGSDSSLMAYWTYVYYPQDRAAPVTQFVVQWDEEDSFDTPEGWVDSEGHDCDHYASLGDARTGECVTGDECGCGSDDNELYRGPDGLTADEACCVCKDTCGSFVAPVEDFYSTRINDDESRRILHYNITQLKPGTVYTTRICSINIMGRGRCRMAAFEQFDSYEIIPRAKSDVIPFGTGVQLNTVPFSDSVSVLESSTSLKVSFKMPSDVNGADVEEFLVEWWDLDAVKEVKVLDVSSAASMNGTFRLSYNGDITDYLDHDSSVDVVRTALEALADIRAVKVFRSPKSSGFGYEWAITFPHDFPTVLNRALTVDGSGIFSESVVHAAVIITVVGALPHGYGSHTV
jgi:hypothetical protein